METKRILEINDLVWAQRKGFPWWPGRITEPTDLHKNEAKENTHCVYFFGSKHYEWIENNCLKSYFELKDPFKFDCKTSDFIEACRDIEQYILETCENNDELQYLNHIRKILENGHKKMDRTKTGTLSIFGVLMRYNLKDGIFPLLTTKRVFWRGVVEELLWFIKGSTSSKELSKKDVKIWDANSTRSYLDSIGLTNREEGDLGPVYGFQWRHYGAEYIDMHRDYSGKGIDQLQKIIDTIKSNPNDRRMVMIAYNPCDIPKMALPPCHCLAQFFVADGHLSCQMYQRSADMGLGVPFNIASYSLLTYMIAHVTGLKPGEFIHTIGDSHVYLNHIDALQIQLQRRPRKFPTLTIKREVNNIDDFKYDDFVLDGYKPYPKISMEMAV